MTTPYILFPYITQIPVLFQDLSKELKENSLEVNDDVDVTDDDEEEEQKRNDPKERINKLRFFDYAIRK